MAGRTRQNPPAAVLAADPLDFATLAGEAERTRVVTGSTKYGGPKNPYLELVRLSYQEDTEKRGSGWRRNVVKGSQVRELVNCLREAAEWLTDEGIGIRFKYRFRNDAEDVVEQGNLRDTKNKKTGVIREGVPEDDRTVEVKYTGRTRRGAEEPDGDPDDTDPDEEEVPDPDENNGDTE